MGEREASMFEIAPIRPVRERYDVAILGGGLAGLTLALQLKAQRPDTSVLVCEKREGPAPLAAFKVGESTVSSGAHYFADVIGMRDHLLSDQLLKCALRFFAPAAGNEDITRRIEWGAPVFPPHDNYQIDRGRFENELARRCRQAGVDLRSGARVVGLDLGDAPGGHSVTFSEADVERVVGARWVVDAAGRASLIKRELGLSKEVPHTINSVWFRLAGGLDYEQWGIDDEAWMSRVAKPGIRVYSTTHLLGKGYWVWLIPLASGPISIGICADPRFHPFEEMHTLDGALEWLRRHEPQLHGALEVRLGDFEDFLRVQDFAYGCARALSPSGWCLVGEAAAFADPFYSPGSDFIGYGNTFAADVIARELDGDDVAERVEFYNGLYLRFFEKQIQVYNDLYEVMGNPLVVIVKIAWDGFYNHWLPTLLMTRGKLTDVDFIRSIEPDLERGFALNARMQDLFKAWNQLEDAPLEGVKAESARLRPFGESLFGIAGDEDDAQLAERIRRMLRQAEAIAVQIFHKAAQALPEHPDPRAAIDPYAISLDPARWEADGLFSDTGLTLAEAASIAEGVEGLWVDELAAAAAGDAVAPS